MNHFVLSRSHLITLGLALYLTAALVLVGCGSITPSSAPPLPLTQVRVQIDWTYTIDVAAFYVAEAKSYYADQGLALKLLPGGYDAQGNYINMVDTVLAGKADFGVTTGVDLLQARARNAPLVAIAAIYQRYPLAFTSLAEKKIIRPQDLVGKTVQVTPGNMLLFQALLTAQGIDPAKVKTVTRTDLSIAPLTKGEADVIDTWITDEGAMLKVGGYAVNTILPVDYGIEEYPNVIFTTEQMITNHPDLVERFLRATLRGMQGAINDPKSVPPLVKRYDSTLNLAEQTEAMLQSLPFLNPAGSRLGMMTTNTWEVTYRIMRDQGLLERPLDVKAAYTLAFLDKVYPPSGRLP